ncbi:MAG: flagellar filament capping protein FliD [Planctomycetota bacterium]
MVGMTGVDGLATGLPTAEIIDSMIQAERQSVVGVEQRKELAELRLESVRTLNLRMLDADTDLFYLRRASTFNAKSVTSSDTAALGASATSVAAAGSYSVSVEQLAQAHQVATAGQASKTDAVFTGTVSITVGSGEAWSISFDEATSLEDVATAINRDADSGVLAQVVSDTTTDPANPYRLVLTGRETGAANTIGVTSTMTGGSPDDDPFATLSENQAAQDAVVSMQVGSGAGAFTATATSADNTIDDLIDGVTFEANAVATDVTVDISFDSSQATERVSDFVESLNGALSYFRDNADYNQDTGEAGVLFNEGDIRRSLASVVRTAVSGAPDRDAVGDVAGLADIGISYDEDSGLFELDESELASVMASDPEGVRDLFVAGGLGDAINERVKALTQSVDGVLANKQDFLTGQISHMDERITRMDELLAQRRERYEAEFLQLEKLTAYYQNQQQFLTSQIRSFQNMASDGKDS